MITLATLPAEVRPAIEALLAANAGLENTVLLKNKALQEKDQIRFKRLRCCFKRKSNHGWAVLKTLIQRIQSAQVRASRSS